MSQSQPLPVAQATRPATEPVTASAAWKGAARRYMEPKNWIAVAGPENGGGRLLDQIDVGGGAGAGHRY